MAAVAVQVCTQFIDTNGVITCGNLEWRTAFLLPPEAESYLTLLMGGFDASAFKLGFAGSIGCFAVGFGAGVVLAILRKARG